MAGVGRSLPEKKGKVPSAEVFTRPGLGMNRKKKKNGKRSQDRKPRGKEGVWGGGPIPLTIAEGKTRSEARPRLDRPVFRYHRAKRGESAVSGDQWGREAEKKTRPEQKNVF